LSKIFRNFFFQKLNYFRNEEFENDQPYMASNLVVQHFTFLKLKEIVLKYLNERILRLRTMRWEIGKVPEHTLEECDEIEIKYVEKYDNLLSKYSRKVGINVSYDMDPPKDVFIEIRALKDFGKFETENGTLNITKNLTYYLKRMDAEPLIKQGIAQVIHDK
jgi:GINS complex subunit 1